MSQIVTKRNIVQIIAALACTLLLVFFMAGCSSSDNSNDQTSTSTSSENTTQTTDSGSSDSSATDNSSESTATDTGESSGPTDEEGLTVSDVTYDTSTGQFTFVVNNSSSNNYSDVVVRLIGDYSAEDLGTEQQIQLVYMTLSDPVNANSSVTITTDDMRSEFPKGGEGFKSIENLNGVVDNATVS
jgi:hypothetical protein